MRRRQVLAAASAVLALGVLEAVGRWTCPPVPVPDGFIYDTGRGWALPASQQVVWRGQSVRVNSLGLRGHEPVEGADVLRVLVLGDSSVFGHDLEEGETFSAVLERLLALDGPADVQNGGVPGYTCLQSRQLLAEVSVRYDLDVLVIYAMHSDARAAAEGDRSFAGAGPWGALGIVRLGAELALRLRVARGRPAGWLETYRECLSDLVAAGQRDDGRAVLVLPVVRGDLAGDPGPCRPDALDLCHFRETMRGVAEQTGSPLVDLPAMFVGQRAGAFMLDDVHPSATGSAAIAMSLYEAVRPLGR